MKLTNPLFVLDSYNQFIPQYSARHGILIGNWREESIQRAITGTARTNGGRHSLRSSSAQCRAASPSPSPRDNTFERVIGTPGTPEIPHRSRSMIGYDGRGRSIGTFASGFPLSESRSMSHRLDRVAKPVSPREAPIWNTFASANTSQPEACGGNVFDPKISLPTIRANVKNSLEKKLGPSTPFTTLSKLLGGPTATVPISKFVDECCIDSNGIRNDLARVLSLNSKGGYLVNVAHAINILA